MRQRPISILVVEDDKFILSAYETKFENEGFMTKSARDGIEAVRILKNFSPDVVILDILLPKSDGFTVLKELKKNKALTNVPVIMATNLDDKLTVHKAHALGANEYVVKSGLSLKDLVNRIYEIKNEILQEL